MTGISFQPTLGGMAKRITDRPRGTPGRKSDAETPPARSAFQKEFVARVKDARAQLGRQEGHEVTQEELARRLSAAVGYAVPTDRYSKYERQSDKPTMMPHDLLFAFAAVTQVPLPMLLAPVTTRALLRSVS